MHLAVVCVSFRLASFNSADYCLRLVPSSACGFYSFATESQYFKGHYQFRDKATLLAQIVLRVSTLVAAFPSSLFLISYPLNFLTRSISRKESLSRKENRNKDGVIFSSDTNMSKLPRIVAKEEFCDHLFTLSAGKFVTEWRETRSHNFSWTLSANWELQPI